MVCNQWHHLHIDDFPAPGTVLWKSSWHAFRWGFPPTQAEAAYAQGKDKAQGAADYAKQTAQQAADATNDAAGQAKDQVLIASLLTA